MRTQPTHPRLSRPRWGTCALGTCLAAGLAGQALAQVDPAEPVPAAAFEWRIRTPADPVHAPAAEPTTWTLDPGPDIGSAEAEEVSDSQAATDAWMLSRWTPSGGAWLPGSLDAAFRYRPVAIGSTSGRADRWARSVFSSEASLLTPLTPGREVIGWELTDGLTLSGVGSRRVLTDRERGFVLSAEAGIRLSPNAGFQFGYELLQASAGPAGDGLGAESVFARFQLRF